jgi:hypothetical protein
MSRFLPGFKMARDVANVRFGFLGVVRLTMFAAVRSVLAGIGALAIPGLGPFIAAGPIMAGLAGLGVDGAIGGLIGALIGMGMPEYEAKRYEVHSCSDPR